MTSPTISISSFKGEQNMLTGKDYRQLAKASLGDKIFGSIWLMAVVTTIVYTAVTGIAGVIPGVGSVISILITGAISTGIYSIFLKLSRGSRNIQLSDMFNHFDGSSIVLGLLTAIFTVLWSLLFIIPGIIMAYSYSMVYFVHLDHPEYTARQCLSESTRLMRGNKWRLFCLQFSFIGWEIIGSLCLGIGILWVSAWSTAATAEFYNDLIAHDTEAV